MADVDITPVAQTINERSADLVGAGTAISSASANTFIIAVGARPPDRITIYFEADGSGDTVTITAGDRPPAQRAGLGSVDIVLAASDLRSVTLEIARFVQDDGTIEATCGDDGTACYATITPRT